jgi:hypothetical protein
VVLLDDSYVFSATDVSGYLACEHLLALNRRAASGTLERPIDTGGLAAHYGNEFEQGFTLATLHLRLSMIYGLVVKPPLTSNWT